MIFGFTKVGGLGEISIMWVAESSDSMDSKIAPQKPETVV